MFNQQVQNELIERRTFTLAEAIQEITDQRDGALQLASLFEEPECASPRRTKNAAHLRSKAKGLTVALRQLEQVNA